MRPPLLLVLALLIAASATPARTVTWRVPGHCLTIQAGVDSAAIGDTVLVACDTYYEHDIIMKSGVCLTSETGEAACVTIDAQQQGRVIYCLDVDDAASIVGFTATGGLAPDGAALLDSLGGGIYCENSSPTLENCTFSGNTASLAGGGMSCYWNAHPTLTSCTFSDDTASFAGGGMFCYWNADPTLTDCAFSGNSSGEGGGMTCMVGCFPTLTDCTFSGNIAYDGAGMMSFISFPTLTGCTFSDNTATSVGGGMTSSESVPTLIDCMFSDNSAGESGGGLRVGANELAAVSGCRFLRNNANSGGGVWVHSGGNLTLRKCRFAARAGVDARETNADREAIFENCSFARNQAVYGGGLHCQDEVTALLANCTFKRNAASGSGGGIYCENWTRALLANCIIAFGEGGGAVRCSDDGSVALVCSDVYGNDGGDWDGCIAGQGTVDGNFSEDPLFCGEANPGWPLTLWSDSPCAAENNPACGLVGAWDVGCDTPVESASWGSIKAMFR